MTAWGADINDIATETRQTALSFFDAADNLLMEMLFEELEVFEQVFFGVDLMGVAASFARFDFRSVGDEDVAIDMFALDNMVFSVERDGSMPAPVPLPAGLVLLLTAMSALGLRRAFR